MFHASLEDLREVELSLPATNELSAADLPSGVELLGQTTSGKVTLAWIRYHDGLSIEDPLPGELRRRNVNLEQIYLALTNSLVRGVRSCGFGKISSKVKPFGQNAECVFDKFY